MKNGQRVIGITLLGMIILAGCMLASVAYGSNLIPIGQVLQALQNPDSGTFEASVVWARIPRTVFGVLAGAALGVSGALMQAVTRNPIADPSVLGVNTGASLFVVIGIAWMHITSSQQYIWLAFAGAALTAVFVYGIASVGYGGPTSIKRALAGTATGTACQYRYVARQFCYERISLLAGRQHQWYKLDRDSEHSAVSFGRVYAGSGVDSCLERVGFG